MTGNRHQDGDPAPPLVYQFHLKGWLAAPWREWFGGLAVTLTADGDTLLTGPVADQAALHGLLKKVRDLGLTLHSVNPIDPDRRAADAADTHQP